MSAHEHIDELLSGFLDGELTGDEMREVQAAMAADTELVLKVEQLRELGSELRSLPQRKLPPNFAARVLAATQAEAIRAPGAQLRADHSALATSSLDVSSPVPASSASHSHLWRSASISILAAAASLFVVAYLSGWIAVKSRSGGTEQLAEQLSNGATEKGALENVARDTVARDTVAGDTEDLQMPDMGVEPEAAVVGGDVLVGNERPMPSASQMGLEILTILEIQPSKEARNLDLIASVLKQAGIDWSTPVTASSDVVNVLNATRSINQGPGRGGDDQVALVLVRAPSVNVDRAMNMFWERNKDFPFVLMDMAFDIPGKDLVHKLLEAQQAAVGDAQSLATPIVLSSVATKDLDDVAQFSSAPQSRYVASNERSKPFASEVGMGAPVTSSEEEAPTHLLLVIRKPAE